eukprot:gene23988-biopygen9757
MSRGGCSRLESNWNRSCIMPIGSFDLRGIGMMLGKQTAANTLLHGHNAFTNRRNIHILGQVRLIDDRKWHCLSRFIVLWCCCLTHLSAHLSQFAQLSFYLFLPTRYHQDLQADVSLAEVVGEVGVLDGCPSTTQKYPTQAPGTSHPTHQT